MNAVVRRSLHRRDCRKFFRQRVSNIAEIHKQLDRSDREDMNFRFQSINCDISSESPTIGMSTAIKMPESGKGGGVISSRKVGP
jgi:hypothetical protein